MSLIALYEWASGIWNHHSMTIVANTPLISWTIWIVVIIWWWYSAGRWVVQFWLDSRYTVRSFRRVRLAQAWRIWIMFRTIMVAVPFVTLVGIKFRPVNSFYMFSKGGRVRISFCTAWSLARIRFLQNITKVAIYYLFIHFFLISLLGATYLYAKRKPW